MTHIYCVEDDCGIRELIACALTSGGYGVTGFTCGSELFQALEKGMPSMILLDIMLPGEDGIAILKKLKAHPIYKDVPVIMLTAKSSEIDKVNGLENGADDYMTKPFGIMELLSRIKAVLRRTAGSTAAPSSILRIETLTIDMERRCVFCGEREAILTFKEFELLSYLAKHRGSAISRDRLLEKVWGFQYEGETRTVDAHIKTLRQKLEAAGCTDFIQTVRGYGYKLL
ncbi:MAG: response regulator transcription factor [Ruminococcus sp.]|nr:response regulator transcription factor [Ruminococcus sp.]